MSVRNHDIDQQEVTATPNVTQQQLIGAEADAPQDITFAANRDIALPSSISDGLISREFVMQWDGSLNELSRRPAKATWAVSAAKAPIFQSRTRYAPGCEKADTRMGDLSKVCLVGMKITKIDSTFPCSVALCVAGAKGNVYSNSGEQFAALISPNEKQHNLEKVIVTTNPYVNSAYMQLYPNMTSKNLRSQGMMKVPGENYCFVDQTHPIVEMMAENAEQLQIDMNDAELIDGRWLKVSQAIADRCLDNLESQLTDYLPVTDLNNFAATIHRMHGASWDAQDEVCDNITQESMRDRMMNTKRRLTVCVQMTYSFL